MQQLTCLVTQLKWENMLTFLKTEPSIHYDVTQFYGAILSQKGNFGVSSTI
jgi:hypothetical protein